MRTIWITGGGTGIGRALAERYFQNGDRVIISGRRPDVLAEAVRSISGKDTCDRLWTFAGDAADKAHADHVITQLAAHGLSVDILINNAGQNSHHPFSESSLEDFEQAFRANCGSALQCTQAVLPAMRQKRAGAIVLISSVLGKFASSDSAAYSVAKYAVSGLIDVLRQDLIDSGVQVLGVYPGFIQTAMTLPFVTPQSAKAKFGKKPSQMADAIIQALRQGKTELHYPAYVPWLIRLNHWMPQMAARLAKKFRQE